MVRYWAAWAAMLCVAAWPPGASARDSAPLTLEQAFTLTLERHPALERLPLARVARAAARDEAAQKPPLTAGATLENVLGSGDTAGFGAAELSLSLSSVIERGDKREARVAVAQGRLDALANETRATRLDLLAEVARRYLDALAIQAAEAAAADLVDQRTRTAAAAARRVSAGASPRPVQLAAEAALARATLERELLQTQGAAARRRLAATWGERDPGFERLAGDLLALPAVPAFEALTALLDRSPELRRFADERRLREARLQLARSAGSADLAWDVGVRRLQATGDTALIAGLSLPLGSRTRARPGIVAAEAELADLELERESEAIGLYATLAEAHGRLLADRQAVSRADTDVLPRLVRAEEEAGRSYRAGALSYLEWAQLQADLLAARRDQITAARDFHRALIEIQRLTGDAFAADEETP